MTTHPYGRDHAGTGGTWPEADAADEGSHYTAVVRALVIALALVAVLVLIVLI